MKTILIGKTDCHAASRIKEEHELRGHQCRLVPIQHLVLRAEQGMFTVSDTSNGNLDDADVYIFRGMSNQHEALAVLARYLQNLGKVVLEDVFARRGMHMDKFSPTMIQEHIPVPDYSLSFSYPGVPFDTIQYPVVLKALDGSKGEKVRLANDREDVERFLGEFGYPVIVQRYVPIRYDFRVLVIAGQVVGAMKRYNTKDDFLTTRRGGGREAVEIPEEARSVAVHCAHVAELDVAGVDLIEQDGVYYRLEVNMSPQFKTFERVTGINVAGKICDMLEMKAQSRAS